MENYNFEDLAAANDYHTNKWPVFVSTDDDDTDEVEEERAKTDWGDIDPAGGPAPTSPGSAV